MMSPLTAEPNRPAVIRYLEDSPMPRYFFDVKDGHRLVDPAGRECRNDAAAKDMAKALAIVVSIDTPAVDPTRYISVLNDAKQEIFQAAVYSKPVAA
jgi:hypothetical protein